MEGQSFNPPPGWPKPPAKWKPPPNWVPDARWPEPPPGWQLWIPDPAVLTAELIEEPRPLPEPVATPAPTVSTQPANPPREVEPISLTPPPTTWNAPPSAEDPAEIEVLRARVADLEAELAQLRQTSDIADLVVLDDARVLQEVGIYRYHHPLESAAGYKDRLAELDRRIGQHVAHGKAILANDMFTFNNSLAKGRKMVADLSRLMLRAYNAEADNCVRSLRAGNVVTAKRRLDAAVSSIAKLGSMMEMRSTPISTRYASRRSS